MDGEELCMAVIPRAGGHEGFAGRRPRPRSMTGKALWGFPGPWLPKPSPAARGRGRREAEAGTVSGEKKRVVSEGSRRANSRFRTREE